MKQELKLKLMKKEGTETKEPEKPKSVEDTLGRLEEIVQSLGNDEITLAESIKLFEEGVKLADQLKISLEESELRIRKVLESSEGFELSDFPRVEQQDQLFIGQVSEEFEFFEFGDIHGRSFLDCYLPAWP